VSEPVTSSKLDRRALVLGAVFLLGGAAALTRFTRKSATKTGAEGPALSGDQFMLLEQVTETMIPGTDTPGAIGVGVPLFVRDMLTDWASGDTRIEIIAVLESVERQAWAQFGAAFLELSAERRLAVLRRYDEDALGRQDPAYTKFKYLVLVGYYQSEIGATQELRYELVPGAWRSCLPLAEVGRAAAV
jgi:gluconate 2-dehydrogenase gamma chain